MTWSSVPIATFSVQRMSAPVGPASSVQPAVSLRSPMRTPIGITALARSPVRRSSFFIPPSLTLPGPRRTLVLSWGGDEKGPPRAPPLRGGRDGVPAGARRGLHLERRHLSHRESHAGRPRRPPPHLDAAAGERAVLPDGVHVVLGREAPLGPRPVRVPPRQRAAARRFGPPALAAPRAPGAARRVARGRRVRAPPDVRGIRRVGHRAQEHAFALPLPARDARVLRVAGNEGRRREGRRFS